MSYILKFGKHKNKTIDEVFESDRQYLQWLLCNPLTKANSELFDALENKIKNKNDYYMTFGKFKNKPLSWIIKHHPDYIMWLRGNNYVKQHFDKLYKIVCAVNI